MTVAGTVAGLIDRRAAVAQLVAGRTDNLLVVGGLGAATWDLAAAGEHHLDFGLWGAMGGAVLIGLGLALAQPNKRVLVVTGDGEMLMGMGGLATIALQQPANLAIVVLDNGLYGETGGHASHTARGADLAAIARGCGLPVALTIAEPDRIGEAVSLACEARGPVLVVLKIAPDTPPPALSERDPVLLKERFRAALGVQAGFTKNAV